MSFIKQGLTGRRRRAMAVPVVAALAVLILGTVLTGQGSATPHHLRFVQFDDKIAQTFVDVGTKDFSTGDQIFEDGAVYDSAGKNIVGNALTKITVATVHGENDFSFFLDCTFFLEDGRITFNGADEFSNFLSGKGIQFAVDGGTGAYKRATGTVRVLPTTIGGESGATITFDIKAPQG